MHPDLIIKLFEVLYTDLDIYVQELMKLRTEVSHSQATAILVGVNFEFLRKVQSIG